MMGMGVRTVAREEETPVRKVLFVAAVYNHLATFHLPFMHLLQERGCQVHAAASPLSGGKSKSRIEMAGFKCWDVPFARSLSSVGNLRACLALHRLLQQERYSLIHVHTPVAAWITRFVASLGRKTSVVYTAHGFHFYRGAPLGYWLLYYPAERLAARWTDGLVVMNEEDWTRAKRMGFVSGKNLFLVHGVGVDLGAYCSASNDSILRNQLGVRLDEVAVCCVAEMIPRKNHAMLMEAWKLVARSEERAHLLLVGDGPLRGKLETKVLEDRIPRVHFLGVRADVPAILAGSAVLVLSSKQEGLARCIMEAMAAGRPVVATDIRGNRDLVVDGETGFLVKLGDTAGLAHSLLQLLGDPGLRQRMGQAGCQRVKDYSLERVLDEMAAVYDRCLGERTTPPGPPSTINS
jgi:glycosyltransferase involved in cell wall biosynthesis